MGTEVRHKRSTGNTYEEAFKNLVDEDTYERGHDYYNSSFNSLSLLREVKILPEHIGKGYAVGVCIKKPTPNTNKTKSEVINHPLKGTREWVTEYYAVDPYDFKRENRIDIKAETQTECIQKARAYVEKHPGVTLQIHIRKVLKKVPTLVAEIKYKKAADEAPGEWEFMGGCPC